MDENVEPEEQNAAERLKKRALAEQKAYEEETRQLNAEICVLFEKKGLVLCGAVLTYVHPERMANPMTFSAVNLSRPRFEQTAFFGWSLDVQLKHLRKEIKQAFPGFFPRKKLVPVAGMGSDDEDDDEEERLPSPSPDRGVI